MPRALLSVIVGVPVMALGVVASLKAAQSSTGRPAMFTDAQAKSGAVVYARACAGCHGHSLTGGAAPPLTGPSFARSWRDPRITLDDLFFIHAHDDAAAPGERAH